MKKLNVTEKLLMLLISFVLIFMGAVNVVTQHYYGETTKRGFAQILLNGSPAVIMGFFLIFMGLISIGVFLKNKRQLKYWLFFCIAGILTSLFLLFKLLYKL